MFPARLVRAFFVYLEVMMSVRGNGVVFNVGINDADYVVQCGGFICPFYLVWQNMLRRCYSASYQERQPTYKGCTVCEEWLLFSAFKVWMENQYYEGLQLDKDLLSIGNKTYSPDTCLFIPQIVNTFMSERGNDRGEYPIGVGLHKKSQTYRARCGTLDGRRAALGYFSTPEAAHEAWLNCKTKLAHELASRQTDSRIAEALIDRYENYHNYFPL
jgi:hypothetical protein